MHRNLISSAALAVIISASLLSPSKIVRGSNQTPAQQTEAGLMSAGQGVPDAQVVLKPKLVEQPIAAPSRPGGFGRVAAAAKPAPKGGGQANKRTEKDGSFSFENVPVGTYNLTFDAPKVSPAMSGKVEYLVIVQQVEAGAAHHSATITYDDSKAKTARIPVAKINEGFEFTVGSIPPVEGVSPANSNKKKPAVTDSQPPQAIKSQPVNLRGKIFLVKIGTNIPINE